MADSARKRSIEQRRRVQIVFQNPVEALNPRYSVEAAIARPAHLLRGLNAKEASAEVARLLEAVRLPAGLARRYPRELSGGECQRVAIARALAANPEVLVCDEVTSALRCLCASRRLGPAPRTPHGGLGLAILFITHDLGVVATVADRVLVLQHGVICEENETHAMLSDPQDEYTKALLAGAPQPQRVDRSLGIRNWTPRSRRAGAEERTHEHDGPRGHQNDRAAAHVRSGYGSPLSAWQEERSDRTGRRHKEQEAHDKEPSLVAQLEVAR